ncbi:hypothetical protein EDD18DRAFT_1111549 [Armillaria luteobubalina]|uniref:Uncharacterized protein n=1 Tax=Armillaria luteobubalina TaxID=153913 RepID=A0AA39PKT1_9AGAR|nr:hypothetical protein EDD18DRAFT_1111549 [Armillaria luteobubalina]
MSGLCVCHVGVLRAVLLRAHPHGQLTLNHKVSYGELSAKEVESVVAPSDVDDADLSANSLKCHGQVLFVDYEASEASHVSEEPSANEDDYGSDCEAGSEDGTVVLSLCSLRSKVKTVKGSYVDALLHSGNVDDVAESDDIKNDLTLTVISGGSGTLCSQVMTKRQVPYETGQWPRLTDTVHTAGNTVADSSDEQAESHTHANPVTPVQPMSSPSKSVAGIKTTVASSVGHGSAKSIFSDDPDDDLTPAAVPASQITNELAALLGDDVCGSLPEPDDAGPVLCLPKIGVTPYKPWPDLSKPDDPALQVMQPELMEEHLVTLGVYVSLPLLGMYRAVIPMGFALDTFDPPRFCSFTDMAKLFHLESLTSLVKAFKFEWYGCFINLACAMPSALTLEGKTLHQGGYTSASGTQGDMSAHASPIKDQWRSLTKTLTAESVSPGASYPMSMGFLDEGCLEKFVCYFSDGHLAFLPQLPWLVTASECGALFVQLPMWLAGLPVFNRFNDVLEDTILADIEEYTEGLEVFEFLDEINSSKHCYYLYMD